MNDNFESLGKVKLLQFIQELNKSSNQLYIFLDNLLNWSKTQIEGFILKPAKIDLSFIIDNCFELFRVNAQIKKINLISSIRPKTYVFADKEVVSTIIRNLVSNAIKFTGENGTVKISTNDLGAKLEIEVADTGIGMSDYEIQNLFKIDKQTLKIGTADEKGTGLGLYLCKELIEKSGGEIWVQSELNKGSKFIFSVPKY